MSLALSAANTQLGRLSFKHSLLHFSHIKLDLELGVGFRGASIDYQGKAG